MSSEHGKRLKRTIRRLRKWSDDLDQYQQANVEIGSREDKQINSQVDALCDAYDLLEDYQWLLKELAKKERGLQEMRHLISSVTP